jgi:hypothetical protein
LKTSNGAAGVASSARWSAPLRDLGWSVEHNLRIDHRWASGARERYRQAAEELIALAPDVILVAGAAIEDLPSAQTSFERALRFRTTVFALVGDVLEALGKQDRGDFRYRHLAFAIRADLHSALFARIAPRQLARRTDAVAFDQQSDTLYASLSIPESKGEAAQINGQAPRSLDAKRR